MAIKIDYSVLDDTARYMRELAGSFGQLKNYGQELNSSLNPSLREWALDTYSFTATGISSVER